MAAVEAQRARRIKAYSKGVLSLDELASQKSSLDEEISNLTKAASLLRSETEPLLPTKDRIETIKGIANDMRKSVLEFGNDIHTKRAISQRPEVQVKLSYDGIR